MTILDSLLDYTNRFAAALPQHAGNFFGNLKNRTLSSLSELQNTPIIAAWVASSALITYLITKPLNLFIPYSLSLDTDLWFFNLAKDSVANALPQLSFLLPVAQYTGAIILTSTVTATLQMVAYKFWHPDPENNDRNQAINYATKHFAQSVLVGLFLPTASWMTAFTTNIVQAVSGIVLPGAVASLLGFMPVAAAFAVGYNLYYNSDSPDLKLFTFQDMIVNSVVFGIGVYLHMNFKRSIELQRIAGNLSRMLRANPNSTFAPLMKKAHIFVVFAHKWLVDNAGSFMNNYNYTFSPHTIVAMLTSASTAMLQVANILFPFTFNDFRRQDPVRPASSQEQPPQSSNHNNPNSSFSSASVRAAHPSSGPTVDPSSFGR